MLYIIDIKHQKYHWQLKTAKNEINLHIQGQNKVISLHFDMKMYQINHLRTRHQICDSQKQISAKQQLYIHVYFIILAMIYMNKVIMFLQVPRKRFR